MSNALRTAACLGLGAGLMYIFDPAAGRRRRAFIRDKTGHYLRKAACISDVVSRDIANRMEGFRHEGFRRSALEKLDVLQERWSPATRFLISAGALAVSCYGMTRHKMSGQLLSLASGGLLVEALTNTSLFAHRKQRPVVQRAAKAASAAEHGMQGAQGKPEEASHAGETRAAAGRREETGVSNVPAGEPATAGVASGSAVQGATSGQAGTH